MKKTVALLLTLALVFMLAACGADIAESDDTNAPESSDSASSSQDGSTGNDQNSNDDTDAPENGDSESTGNDQNDNNDKNELSFSEIVVVDNDECTIKITDIDPDNMYGFTVKVYLENKSKDKTYMYSAESASINGVQCDPFFAAEVAAEKKSNNEINFSDIDFDANGIGDYTDIEITFKVYDSDDWLSDEVAGETVHIYPYGEDKATAYVRESQPTDNVIVDNEYVTIIVTGYDNDAFWGYSVNLFLINKTDKDIMIGADEVSVNGYMADPFYAASVTAGKCAFSTMSWFDDTFEENDIATVEEIKFKLTVFDDTDWSDDYLVDEIVTLNP